MSNVIAATADAATAELMAEIEAGRGQPVSRLARTLPGGRRGGGVDPSTISRWILKARRPRTAGG